MGDDLRGGDDPLDVRTSLGRNLTHGMLDRLGREIVTGAFDDAPFPTEADLARRYSVSRSVTREAVKMLTAKGLLSARPRQGTIVQPAAAWNLFDPDVLDWMLDRKLSLRLLRQFNELRSAIEPAAAALAASAATPADLRHIDTAIERMLAAEAGNDDALDADIAFHIAVLNAAGNPFFAQFRPMVKTALRTSIRFTNRINGRGASVPAHAAVRDAIAAGDAVLARNSMLMIIADVMDLIGSAEEA